MTITPELNNRESTHTDACTSTEKEERQREKMAKERAEVEAEGEANQGEDGEKEGKETEKEEKKESLAEESLRMTSWVEVENDRRSAEENGQVEVAGKAEEVRDAVEGQVVLVLEVEGVSMGEAEKEQTRSVEEELAMMEEKWREQCAINETLKQRLANEEERFRVRHTLTQRGCKYERSMGCLCKPLSKTAAVPPMHIQKNNSFVNTD